MSRPILFVHGAWHGGWCWEDWGSEAARRGFTPVAIDLPGHDRPGSTDRLWNGLGSYVRAVNEEIERLGPDTVVVGHSMGGLVAQRALETSHAALAILVASVPLNGVVGATVRTARRIPAGFARANLGLSMYPIVESQALTKAAFFSPSTPAATVRTTHERLQNESYRAYVEMFVKRPRPNRVATPVRVIAAEHDAIFSLAEQRRLAEAYGTEAVVIDGCGHDVMLEPRGRAALDRIFDWIVAV
jgi:pimeloyl-ACP methyl ester carboxylesterase